MAGGWRGQGNVTGPTSGSAIKTRSVDRSGRGEGAVDLGGSGPGVLDTVSERRECVLQAQGILQGTGMRTMIDGLCTTLFGTSKRAQDSQSSRTCMETEDKREGEWV